MLKEKIDINEKEELYKPNKPSTNNEDIKKHNNEYKIKSEYIFDKMAKLGKGRPYQILFVLSVTILFTISGVYGLFSGKSDILLEKKILINNKKINIPADTILNLANNIEVARSNITLNDTNGKKIWLVNAEIVNNSNVVIRNVTLEVYLMNQRGTQVALKRVLYNIQIMPSSLYSVYIPFEQLPYDENVGSYKVKVLSVS